MKKYTQTGTWSLVILAVVLIPMAIPLFFAEETAKEELIGLKIAGIIIFACLLTMYKLTIYIQKDSISFRMGIGWFRKTYKYTEIKSCEPVKNSAMSGFGFRWLGNGWLYNVSGFKAIELRFKNKDSVVRIGTNKPREIANLVREKLENN